MPTWPDLTRRTNVTNLLLGIALVATVLRAMSALYQGNLVEPMPGTFDQVSYHVLAQRVVAGQGFSFAEPWWPVTRAGEPTAHWSYLYTLYLAAVYALFGPQPLVARLIQALAAGPLQVWLTWRIGRRVFGDRVALVAAGICAIYAYFIYYAGALMTETFYIVGILWTLDVALRIARSDPDTGPARRLWAELGLAIGLTVLLRQLFLLFLPLLFLWLWWARSRHGQANTLKAMVPGIGLVSLMILGLIAPFTIRNYRAFDSFVPLNTNSGYILFWANHPIHGTSFIDILPDTGPSYPELIPQELRHLDEAALDRALLARGVGFVVEDPGRYLLLSLSRVKDYFKFWPSADSSPISNVARVASFALALPFMAYGLWRAPAAARSRDKEQPDGISVPEASSALTLLIAFVLLYTLIHLLTWALIRYRLPVDAVLIIFAGLGVVQLASRFASGFHHLIYRGSGRIDYERPISR